MERPGQPEQKDTRFLGDLDDFHDAYKQSLQEMLEYLTHADPLAAAEFRRVRDEEGGLNFEGVMPNGEALHRLEEMHPGINTDIANRAFDIHEARIEQFIGCGCGGYCGCK